MYTKIILRRRVIEKNLMTQWNLEKHAHNKSSIIHILNEEKVVCDRCIRPLFTECGNPVHFHNHAICKHFVLYRAFHKASLGQHDAMPAPAEHDTRSKQHALNYN